MEVMTASTQNTATSIRVTRALIGFGMTLPIVANLGLTPWVTFGLALAGTCLIVSSLIGKTTTEGIVLCSAAILAMAATLATAGTLLNPASIAAVSIASIAAVASGLLGIELAKGKQKIQVVEHQKSDISNINALFPKAANETNVAA